MVGLGPVHWGYGLWILTHGICGIVMSTGSQMRTEGMKGVCGVNLAMPQRLFGVTWPCRLVPLLGVNPPGKDP